MKVVFASAELSPWYKVGGLADVSAALPAALAAAGHDVRVFVPLYDRAGPAELRATPVDSVQDVLVSISGRHDTFHLFERPPASPDEPHLYFVQCAPFYERDGAIYTWHDDEARRFIFFARAVLESLQRLPLAPDILHANDWSTGLLPLFLRTRYAWDELFHHTRTVFTIHNLAYQGIFGADVLADLDLRAGIGLLDQPDLQEGQVNFLKSALQLADRLTTVSPNYAREICTPEYGAGLDPVLRRREADLRGILNGVDDSLWDPAHDRFLPVRYDANSLWRKMENKVALLERCELDVVPERPVFGLIARLVEQKGIDLVCEVVEEEFEELDAALVVLGQGEEKYRHRLEVLAERHQRRVRLWPAFDESFAHLIEAGSDFFLMPSRFEPCGLNQMYSQLYGTLPIVHRVGGLRDTVRPLEDGLERATGIGFENPTAEDLSDAVKSAMELYRRPEELARVRRNAMAMDWSWDAPARSYEELYAELVASA